MILGGDVHPSLSQSPPLQMMAQPRPFPLCYLLALQEFGLHPLGSQQPITLQGRTAKPTCPVMGTGMPGITVRALARGPCSQTTLPSGAGKVIRREGVCPLEGSPPCS